MMAQAKSTPPTASVEAFITALEDPGRRDDARAVVTLLTQVSGEAPTMWGSSIIGFGRYHYRYESGHEGDAPLVGFSPRKANLVFYLAPNEGLKDDLLARLGKHRTGKGCLYINRLSDVDPEVLQELAASTITMLKARYPA